MFVSSISKALCGCVFVRTFLAAANEQACRSGLSVCVIEKPDGFQGHVVLAVCLPLQEPALGSAGFNQHHHLPLLRVIGTQWAPSATLPSTSAPQTPFHTVWCFMYLHCLLCIHSSQKIQMCAATLPHL